MTLPDPHSQPEFYEDVVSKRLIAWFIDVALIATVTAILTVFSLFTALCFLPFLYATVGFLYRWVGLTRHSATIGMRVMSLEFRKSDGEDFDGATSFLHTAGYYVSVAVFPLQLISKFHDHFSVRRKILPYNMHLYATYMFLNYQIYYLYREICPQRTLLHKYLHFQTNIFLIHVYSLPQILLRTFLHLNK